MSKKTQAALDEAYAACLAGDAAREDVEAAALAHLDSVDRGYQERTAGLEPQDRIVAPDLKDAYDEALEASLNDPGDQDLAAAARELGEQYEAARTAARVAEGRPLTTTLEG